ncbi:MAG: hypothetical protein R3F31_11595 [Verrucomicrobiales bacterium]
MRDFRGRLPGYGLMTLRHPVVQVTAEVTAFDNAPVTHLRVLRIDRPRPSTNPKEDRRHSAIPYKSADSTA